jgi:hypothetical protein
MSITAPTNSSSPTHLTWRDPNMHSLTGPIRHQQCDPQNQEFLSVLRRAFDFSFTKAASSESQWRMSSTVGFAMLSYSRFEGFTLTRGLAGGNSPAEAAGVAQSLRFREERLAAPHVLLRPFFRSATSFRNC